MKRKIVKNLKYPWYGNYTVMLTCTDHEGNRHRHPVAWFANFRDADRLLTSMMTNYYRGSMHRIDDVPVIVDYTGMSRQLLPASYNDVIVEGDLTTL